MRIRRLSTLHAPVFLVNSRLALVSAASSGSGREVRHPTKAPLLPKLRGHFAEFLNQSYPDRLSILYLPTCVGLGYGHRVSSLEVFLGSVGSLTSPVTARHRISALRPTDLPMGPPTCLPRVQPAPGRPTLLRPPFATRPRLGRFARRQPLSKSLRDWRGHGGTGISTGCASTTPFGLALAPD